MVTTKKNKKFLFPTEDEVVFTSYEEETYEEVNSELKDLLILIDDDKEAQIAYREIPEEEFADKWAVDFMKAHFAKELCAC